MGYILKCLKRLNNCCEYKHNIQAVKLLLNLILDKKLEIIEMQSICVATPFELRHFYEMYLEKAFQLEIWVFNMALIVNKNIYQLRKKYRTIYNPNTSFSLNLRNLTLRSKIKVICHYPWYVTHTL